MMSTGNVYICNKPFYFSATTTSEDCQYRVQCYCYKPDKCEWKVKR